MNININGQPLNLDRLKLQCGVQEIHISCHIKGYGVQVLENGKLIGLEEFEEFPMDLVKGHLTKYDQSSTNKRILPTKLGE